MRPGDVLTSRYQLTAHLDSGAMGDVWTGSDLQLKRTVAVKFLKDDARSEELSRFFREGPALATFNHPNICTAYDFGTHDGRPFLVMEHLSGESLKSRLKSGRLEPKCVLSLARDMASALNALQIKGIVHRDIKPGNIFITHHGNKLLDFGLAKKLKRPDDVSTTEHGTNGRFVGTPGYASPEQEAGRAVDHRADLYSLGRVLFECSTGLGRGTAFNRARFRPEFPHTLIDIIERLLEAHPEERYQRSSALAEALTKIHVSDSRRRYSAVGFCWTLLRLTAIVFLSTWCVGDDNARHYLPSRTLSLSTYAYRANQIVPNIDVVESLRKIAIEGTDRRRNETSQRSTTKPEQYSIMRQDTVPIRMVPDSPIQVFETVEPPMVIPEPRDAFGRPSLVGESASKVFSELERPRFDSLGIPKALLPATIARALEPASSLQGAPIVRDEPKAFRLKYRGRDIYLFLISDRVEVRDYKNPQEGEHSFSMRCDAVDAVRLATDARQYRLQIEAGSNLHEFSGDYAADADRAVRLHCPVGN